MLQTQFQPLRNVVAVDPAPVSKPDQNAINCASYVSVVVTADRPCKLVPYWWNDHEETWHRGSEILQFTEAGGGIGKIRELLAKSLFLRVEECAGISPALPGNGGPDTPSVDLRLCVSNQRHATI